MSKQRDAFFAGDLYLVDVSGWPADQVYPEKPLTSEVDAPPGARMVITAIHPHDRRPLPSAVGGAPALLDTAGFSLRNSGNRTLWAPKRSWAIEFADDELAGMEQLNLKAMYNDPSQMREALCWRLFETAGVPAPRQTYARLGINGRYLGLFSVIEEVDRAFVRSRFGKLDNGNLFKIGCGDLGCGTLERRVGAAGEDDGRPYVSPDRSNQTYRLTSYADSPEAKTYDDLATLTRTVDGAGLPGGDARFDTDAYAASVRSVFAAEDFLRWAGVNVLAGSWDNYFATPANYYLYNSGAPDVMANPYFHFIPWDYDNSFGIDYFGVRWQDTDLVDWPANTEAYHRFNNGNTRRTHLPLVTNLLANTGFRRYYLDHLEHLLDTVLSPESIDAAIGFDPAGAPTSTGLWDRVAASAYLESRTPFASTATGRQFTNDEVYRAARLQYELRHGNAFILGIHHFSRMRYERAREQLVELRLQDPAGSSGATFSTPGAPVAVPVG